MQRYRFLSSLVLTAALLAPATSHAAARSDGRHDQKTVRVYDRSHKDYHVWDDREDHTYRQYLGDNHRTYRGISKLSRKQQVTYWNWRHKQD
jgi:hypothetical protein